MLAKLGGLQYVVSGDAEGCCYLSVGTGAKDLVYIKTQSTDIYVVSKL